jgi:NAD(P)-dependent dehydrogenase (short-subunit alcohol dehydrogenase family)
MAFRGNTALVTGAGSGMGQIAAWRLAAMGAKVAAVDLNEEGLAKTIEGHSSIRMYRCDVVDSDAVNDLVASVETELGQIDRLTHAAAIMPASPIATMDPALIRKVMRINFEGTVNLVSAISPKMFARQSGDIVMYGSVAGECVVPNMGAYCASKAAVNTYGDMLIRENEGSGVRICLVCPPMVRTPLMLQAMEGEGAAKSVALGHAQGRGADPNDIVDAIEVALEKGVQRLYPQAEAKALHWASRLFPSLMWKIIRKAEQSA